MILRQIAHVRTGDKGDTSQISVIAYDIKDYPLLARAVTVERVAAHFADLPLEGIDRCEAPSVGALILVLRGALRGGVTRSLALDAHGKSLGAQLLDLELAED